MSDIQDTITKIAEANSWDRRIAQIRLIPQKHGTNEHPGIYAEIARLIYVPHLVADFAYIHEDLFTAEIISSRSTPLLTRQRLERLWRSEWNRRLDA